MMKETWSRLAQVALVTGASSGIGRELARIHAERGGHLVLVARSGDKLDALKSELESTHGVEVYVLPKDLSVEGAGRAVYDELASAGIEVEYLVNNAGFGGRGMFHERDWDTERSMIQLNVIALTELCRHFLPDFVARGRGRILNVSSTAGFVPGPLQAVYYATKAFVTSFSNAIAEELRDSGVTVTALLPGPTDTGFASTSGMDGTAAFADAASARTVAEDGYRAMLTGKLEVVSGLPFGQRMALRFVSLTPKRLTLRVIRNMQKVAS